jgi:hypothetical protein
MCKLVHIRKGTKPEPQGTASFSLLETEFCTMCKLVHIRKGTEPEPHEAASFSLLETEFCTMCKLVHIGKGTEPEPHWHDATLLHSINQFFRGFREKCLFNKRVNNRSDDYLNLYVSKLSCKNALINLISCKEFQNGTSFAFLKNPSKIFRAKNSFSFQKAQPKLWFINLLFFHWAPLKRYIPSGR